MMVGGRLGTGMDRWHKTQTPTFTWRRAKTPVSGLTRLRLACWDLSGDCAAPISVRRSNSAPLLIRNPVEQNDEETETRNEETNN